MRHEINNVIHDMYIFLDFLANCAFLYLEEFDISLELGYNKPASKVKTVRIRSFVFQKRKKERSLNKSFLVSDHMD